MASLRVAIAGPGGTSQVKFPQALSEGIQREAVFIRLTFSEMIELGIPRGSMGALIRRMGIKIESRGAYALTQEQHDQLLRYANGERQRKPRGSAHVNEPEKTTEDMPLEKEGFRTVKANELVQLGLASGLVMYYLRRMGAEKAKRGIYFLTEEQYDFFVRKGKGENVQLPAAAQKSKAREQPAANGIALLDEYKQAPSPKLLNEVVRAFKYLLTQESYQIIKGLPPHVELCDLEGYGAIGLLDAIQKYQKGRGRFVSYARIRIHGSIIDELRQLDLLPRSMRKKVKDVEMAKARLKAEGKDSDVDALAAKTGLGKRQVEATIARPRMVSFEGLLGEEGSSDNMVRSMEKEHERRDVRKAEELLEIARRMIELFPPRPRMMIGMYYIAGMKMKKIGELFGLTESRVSQIISRDVEYLKHSLQKYFRTGKWQTEYDVPDADESEEAMEFALNMSPRAGLIIDLIIENMSFREIRSVLDLEGKTPLEAVAYDMQCALRIYRALPSTEDLDILPIDLANVARHLIKDNWGFERFKREFGLSPPEIEEYVIRARKYILHPPRSDDGDDPKQIITTRAALLAEGIDNLGIAELEAVHDAIRWVGEDRFEVLDGSERFLAGLIRIMLEAQAQPVVEKEVETAKDQPDKTHALVFFRHEMQARRMAQISLSERELPLFFGVDAARLEAIMRMGYLVNMGTAQLPFFSVTPEVLAGVLAANVETSNTELISQKDISEQFGIKPRSVSYFIRKLNLKMDGARVIVDAFARGALSAVQGYRPRKKAPVEQQ